jgi:hypothetical protein
VGNSPAWVGHINDDPTSVQYEHGKYERRVSGRHFVVYVVSIIIRINNHARNMTNGKVKKSEIFVKKSRTEFPKYSVLYYSLFKTNAFLGSKARRDLP